VLAGVSFVTRQVGNAVSPVVEILEENGQYTLKSSSTFKNTSVTFRLNEPFDQETPDGRKVKATITLEGDNKLIEVQEGQGKTSKIVREFSPEEIKMVRALFSSPNPVKAILQGAADSGMNMAALTLLSAWREGVGFTSDPGVNTYTTRHFADFRKRWLIEQTPEKQRDLQ